ncbi:toll/interleukin-1 receptor domain-containing protein [Frankia sp. R43]|uniref:toll/interleukin-1 receptor domain-containing protein n=1 Tax=Frankia sp. R43 TaxID=269536 RepID=UPI0006C9F9A1|nr:toll/interleukin-1 receptor domain-containing protein [Frankia sp. R43]
MGADAAADFFVSYATADVAWAEWIGWQLEAVGFRVVLGAWDFVVGSSLVQETQAALSTSARVVVVLSPAYLMSAIETAQWQAVWAGDPTGEERRLLVARVENCPQPGLLRPLIGVDLFGLDDDTARERLIGAAVAARRKPATAPVFPSDPTPCFPGLRDLVNGELRLSGVSWDGGSDGGDGSPREAPGVVVVARWSGRETRALHEARLMSMHPLPLTWQVGDRPVSDPAGTAGAAPGERFGGSKGFFLRHTYRLGF